MPFLNTILNRTTKTTRIIVALLGFLLIGFSDLNAQEVKQQNSVYSFFGLGDLHPSAFASGRSAGYTTQAYRDPLNVNFGNPASYSANAISKFTSFETGIDFNGFRTNTENLSSQTSNSQLSYLALAFPVYKNWGTSIGFLPFSRTNYDVIEPRFTENVGTDTLLYSGDGGFNQIYWGNAYSYKGLSLGVNLSYVFGTSSKRVVSFYQDIPNGFDLARIQNTTAKGWTWKAGLQYEKRVGNVFLSLGASGYTNTKVATSGELLYDRPRFDYEDPASGLPYTVRDSVAALIVQSLEDSKITLPSTFAFGIALSDSLKNRYTISAEVEFTNWEQYQQDLEDLSVYQNSYRLALGVKLRPNYDNSRNVFRRSQYNFGGYYSNGYLNINGVAIPEYGFTTGLEMPLNPQGSARLNLVLDFGQRGSIENGYVMENYIKTTLGFTFNNIWFVKRKYD